MEIPIRKSHSSGAFVIEKEAREYNCAIPDYMTIFITKLQILNYLHCERVAYFAVKKEEKVEAKCKNVECKPPQL